MSPPVSRVLLLILITHSLSQYDFREHKTFMILDFISTTRLKLQHITALSRAPYVTRPLPLSPYNLTGESPQRELICPTPVPGPFSVWRTSPLTNRRNNNPFEVVLSLRACTRKRIIMFFVTAEHFIVRVQKPRESFRPLFGSQHVQYASHEKRRNTTRRVTRRRVDGVVGSNFLDEVYRSRALWQRIVQQQHCCCFASLRVHINMYTMHTRKRFYYVLTRTGRTLRFPSPTVRTM